MGLTCFEDLRVVVPALLRPTSSGLRTYPPKSLARGVLSDYLGGRFSSNTKHASTAKQLDSRGHAFR